MAVQKVQGLQEAQGGLAMTNPTFPDEPQLEDYKPNKPDKPTKNKHCLAANCMNLKEKGDIHCSEHTPTNLETPVKPQLPPDTTLRDKIQKTLDEAFDKPGEPISPEKQAQILLEVRAIIEGSDE